MQRSIPILWGVVVLILILNLLLLDALNLARLTAVETLSKVETILDSLANEVIVYNIKMDQAVPVKVDVPFNRTIKIPLNTVIPIDQELSVPFQMGNSEIQLDVPIKGDFPIDIVVPIDFDETIAVDTVVQLDTTLPVEIDIAQTPLAGYLKQAQQDIGRLRSKLALQDESVVTEEVIGVASANNAPQVDSEPTAANDSPSQQITAVQTGPTATTIIVEKPDLDNPNNYSAAVPDHVFQPDRIFDQSPRLGLCNHAYWPLRLGTTWAYNSSHTSYTQRVDDVANNQVHLSTQYEGQDIQSSLICYQEGLGGNYLGDMRRITELGNLGFSNPRGMFLPHPEVMEDIGKPWTQEYDVTGTIEAYRGDRPVIGNISQGRAVSVYTPTGFETIETPLGPREALRIEQRLDLELNIDFNLDGQTIPATEVVKLTNIYWFVKGIGPVKIHWQGGIIQQGFKIGDIPTNQQSSVLPLAEEQLVFVCILLEGESSECMRIAGVSQSDLTTPPESELEVQGFVFPGNVGESDNTSTGASAIETVGSSGVIESPPVIDESSEKPPETNDDERLALLAYAEAIVDLGERIAEAADEFGKAAIAYRNDEITLAEFQNKFLSFGPKIKGLIQEIGGLSPPSEAEAIHQKFTNGLDQCDEAIDLMDDWFDTHDSGIKEAAVLLVASCIDQVETAGDELEALVNGD